MTYDRRGCASDFTVTLQAATGADGEGGPEEGKKVMGIDEALQAWNVLPPGMWDNKNGPPEWFAVEGPDGIVAYFSRESDALRFRLNEVNRMLNG